MNRRGLPRILITATGSGCGKTTFTSALLAKLVSLGKCPAAFKCGPDYLDPLFHSTVLGVPTGNLDSFFMSDEVLRETLLSESAGADLAVIEGVMGYYDGLGMSVRRSTSELAEKLELPTILLVDCRGRAGSALAELSGFLRYQSPSRIKGVIFHRLSASLYEEAAAAAETLGVVPLGYIPNWKDGLFESRHLGLVKPDEIADFREKIDQISEKIFETVSLERILALAESAEPLAVPVSEEDLTKGIASAENEISDAEKKHQAPESKSLAVRIAVARDSAFCFLYRENLERLLACGATLLFFSPIKDERLPECDGLLLPGGYPELFARELSENTSMRQSVRDAVISGMPTIAECGGFLYLHETLTDESGVTYPMAGVFPKACRYKGFQPHFGYVTLTNEREHPFFTDVVRGHEFHYFESEDEGDALLAVKPDGKKRWKTGILTETMYAGFPHLSFAGNRIAERFTESCRKWKC